METIEVPEIVVLPNQDAPHEMDGVAVVDCLLTRVLSQETAYLQAEYSSEPIDWILKRSWGASGEPVFRSQTLGDFRYLLARFGHHYMADQVYGGYSDRILVQNGIRRWCSLYMSNQSSSGFWIRIYSRPI
jgi:hypothetical protein